MRQTVAPIDLAGGACEESALVRLERAVKAIESTPAGKEIIRILHMLFEVSEHHAIPQRKALDSLFDALRILHARKQKPQPNIQEIAEGQFCLTERAIWTLIAKLTGEIHREGREPLVALAACFGDLVTDEPLEMQVFRLFAEPPDQNANGSLPTAWPPPVNSKDWMTEAAIISKMEPSFTPERGEFLAAAPRIKAALSSLVSKGYLASEYHLGQRQQCYIALKKAYHASVPQTPYARKVRNRRIGSVLPYVMEEDAHLVTLSLTQEGFRYLRDLVLCGETRENLQLIVPFANHLKPGKDEAPVQKPTYAWVFGLWKEGTQPEAWHEGFTTALTEWDDPEVSTGAYAMLLDPKQIVRFRDLGVKEALARLQELLNTAVSIGTGPKENYIFSHGHGGVGKLLPTKGTKSTPTPRKKRSVGKTIAALLTATVVWLSSGLASADDTVGKATVGFTASNPEVSQMVAKGESRGSLPMSRLIWEGAHAPTLWTTRGVESLGPETDIAKGESWKTIHVGITGGWQLATAMTCDSNGPAHRFGNIRIGFGGITETELAKGESWGPMFTSCKSSEHTNSFPTSSHLSHTNVQSLGFTGVAAYVSQIKGGKEKSKRFATFPGIFLAAKSESW